MPRRQITLGSLWRQLHAQTRDFWRLNLYGILATVLLLPVPMLIPLLIDELLLQHPGNLSTFFSRTLGLDRPGEMIIGVTLLVLILRLAAFAANTRKSFYSIRITQRIAYALRHRILRHLERLALDEYESLRSGGIASRTIQEVESVATFVSQAVGTAFSAGLMLLGIAGILLWMEWRLALAVFLLNPLFLGFSKIVGRQTARLLRRRHEAYQRYQELLTETLDLFVQVRAGNQERRFFDILLGRAREIRDHAARYGHRAATAHSASTLLTTGAVDLFRAFGIAAVVYSHLSIGMMIAFLFYLSAMTAPLNQLISLLITWRNIRPSLERINALLAMRQEPLYPQIADPFHGEKSVSVTVEDLRFAYPNGPEILRGVSLHIEKGEHIALIGPSGGGKSTIARLLVGFYPPGSGRILYGGVPIESIGLERVRTHVALMLQESLFFNETIRMNLTLYREIPEKRIYEALAMAQLAEFIAGLEKGLETPIGRNGIRLSGGQKQRLAIARLILSDPKVVIFDEATSALDSETEARLYRSLAPFLEGRTAIIVAHRESTMRQAKHIYRLEGGRVTARGSYASLKRQGIIRSTERNDAPYS